MAGSRMYLTFNREWNRCLMKNLTIKDHKIVFSEQLEQQVGSFAAGVILTCALDSNEHNFYWEHLRLEASIPENSVIRVSYLVSDQKNLLIDDRLVDFDRYLADSEEDKEEKLKATAPFYRLAFSGSSEGLLQARGRYLWLKLEFLVPRPAEFRLDKIKLLLSQEKLIDYLPQIYRDSHGEKAFFPRFLGIFESIFFDIEEKVESMGKYLDYTVAGGEMLRFLASWVCVAEESASGKLLSDEEIRSRIAGIISEYAFLGTKRGIESFVERELGLKPVIVEYFNVKKMIYEGHDREVYKELFGTNPYKFFILLPEKALDRRYHISRFLSELKNNIPAHTEAEIVLLKDSIVLGKHTYLGVNSRVGEYNYVSVDRHISISYDTLIGGREDEE